MAGDILIESLTLFPDRLTLPENIRQWGSDLLRISATLHAHSTLGEPALASGQALKLDLYKFVHGCKEKAVEVRSEVPYGKEWCDLLLYRRDLTGFAWFEIDYGGSGHGAKDSRFDKVRNLRPGQAYEELAKGKARKKDFAILVKEREKFLMANHFAIWLWYGPRTYSEIAERISKKIEDDPWQDVAQLRVGDWLFVCYIKKIRPQDP